MRVLKFRYLLGLVGLGWVLGGAGPGGLLTPALADAPGSVLFEGRVDAEALVWDQHTDGTVTPRLPGTKPLAETDRPVLAVRSLRLLVPLDAANVQVEVVPLAIRRERMPYSLHRGGQLFSDEGIGVTVQRLALGPTFPLVWGESGGNHVFRGYRLQTVLVYPLRVVKGAHDRWTEVEVLERFAIRMLPAEGSGLQPVDVAQRKRFVPGERERTEALLASVIDNPEALTGYFRQDGQVVPEPVGGFKPSRTPTLTGSAVNYLIITTAQLEPVFNVLADFWTKQQGMPAVVATVDWIQSHYRHGSDIQETLRMFIREAYENWGVEYVLLGGDTDLLPPRYVTNTYYPPESSTDIPVDLYFACLDGNWNADGDHLFGEPFYSVSDPGDQADLADEVFVGRAPVTTLETANVFVDKIITYSQTSAESEWTNRNLFAAEVLFPSNYQPGEPIYLDGAEFSERLVDDFINVCTDMENLRLYQAHDRVDTLGVPMYPGSLPLTRQALIDSLNGARYGIVTQIGHGFFFNMSVGDAQFQNVDAENLVNGDNLFLIYAQNCASAAFDRGCLMERFVQNPNGGSVAAVGSSRSAFPYTANNFQEIFFIHLYCAGMNRLGELASMSRLFFLPGTEGDTEARWTTLVNAVLGDPALSLWSGPIGSPQIEAPAALEAGEQLVEVTVSLGGSPVPGARVALVKEDDDFAYDITNAIGQVSLPFTPTHTGEAILTVTGANLEFTQNILPVTTGDDYIAVIDFTVYDDGSDGSVGNGNSQVEAGETLSAYIFCQDTGGSGAVGAQAILSTETPGVTILADTVFVGNIFPGGIQSSYDPFLFQVESDFEDGTLIEFALEVIALNGGPWQSERTLLVKAPEVEAVSVLWSEEVFGSEDAVSQDLNRVALTVALKNFGSGLADHITGVLRTADPKVTLFDTVVAYENISLLERSIGSDYFSLADSNVATAAWSWILFEDNYGRTFRHDFQLDPPDRPENLRANNSLGPDIIALYWDPPQNPDLRGYNVYRSLSHDGQFQRINSDLVDGVAQFQDDGLAPLTRYYYRVGAVDSALVEGEQSDTIGQSTAPPELVGFPLPFALETSSHCAVGDFLGNEELEIILGSDEVYAWTGDGSELFDGDLDAQTHGPITGQDSRFQPAGIAMADLHGSVGLEIVVCERTQKQVHVLLQDGSNLPGWPQDLSTHLEHGWAWATPAVGDIDGDFLPEIVVNSLDGRTWAWNVDGSEVRDGDNNPGTHGVFLIREGWEDEWGVSSPALFDLDGDDACEIIFGTKYGNQEDNFLLAYRYDGTSPDGFPYLHGQGSTLSSPTIADLNDDEIFEIIFITENDSLHVIEPDGSPYPGFPIAFIANNGGGPCPSPAVGDFDQNGILEIVAVEGVAALESQVYILGTDAGAGNAGQPLPGWPQMVPGKSQSSPVVGDIDGDEVLDVIFGIGGSHVDSPNNLYAFQFDGDLVDGFPITLGGPIRPSPFICDLDQDNDVDIVYGGWDRQIHVWDMPYAYDEELVPWPTFRGNLKRDGVFRRSASTPVPVMPPSNTFLVGPPRPNPFNPSTTIRLLVPGSIVSTEPLQVGIFDLRGRQVRSLYDGPAPGGWHILVWDGRDGHGRGQASGVYFLQARRAGEIKTVKMSLVK